MSSVSPADFEDQAGMDFVSPKPLLASVLQDPGSGPIDALNLQMAALGEDKALVSHPVMSDHQNLTIMISRSKFN